MTGSASKNLFRLDRILLLVVTWLLLVKAEASVPPEVKLINVPKKVLPDEFFTIFFDLTNKDSLIIKPTAHLLLPEGWEMITMKSQVQIKPAQTQKSFFTLRPNRLAKAGVHTITLQILVDKRVVLEERILIEIDQIHKVDITPVAIPDFIQGGTSFTCTYEVQNLGNSVEEIILSSTRGTIGGNSKVSLDPHTSYTVKAHYSVPSNLNQKTVLMVDLNVNVVSTNRIITETRLVEALPNGPPKSDSYLRLPIEVSGISNIVQRNNHHVSNAQFDIRGNGHLDTASQHYVDFVLRGPSQINLPQFGSYDQYSLTYTSSKFAATVVDYTLQVSNLTENSRFGRGLRLDYKFGKSGISGFYNQPRFIAAIRNTYGAVYTYRPVAHLILNLNVVSKQVSERERLFDVNIASISTNYQKNALWLETETAVNTALGKTDIGGYLKMYYSPKWFRWSSTLIHAGKNYHGYYTNSTLISNNINSKIGEKLALGAGQNTTKVNQSLDLTKYSTQPYYSNYFGEISYQYNRHNQIRLNYTYREKEDRAVLKQFNYEEQAIRYSYLHTGKSFSLWLDGEVGKTRNRLVSTEVAAKASRQQRIVLSHTFSKYLTLGGNLEYLHTNRYSRQNNTDKYLFYGGNAIIRLKKDLSFSVFYRNNYALDELTENRNFLNTDLTLKLSERHRLNIRGSYTAFPGKAGTEKNWLASAKYTLLINAPIRKNKSLGSIHGRVVGKGNEKVSGVIVQLGNETTITDESGSFRFYNLAPGKYYVTVRRSSLNLDEIPAIPLPLEINLEASQSKEILIPVIKSASIKGSIEIEASSQDELLPLEKTGSKNKMIIKLTNAENTFYTETNDKGTFSFDEVRAGEWTISVVKTGMWENEYIIDAEWKKITLKAGQETMTSFKLIPKEKKVYMKRGKTIKVQKE